jgi:predicted phage tail protein
VAATPLSAGTISLAWADRSSTETGFRIERRTLAGNFAPLFTLNSANVTAFADATASEGTTYEYRVFAFNATGDSASSNIATASTPPLAPTNLTAAITAGAPLTVTLAWVDNSAMESGFTIQRATNTGFTAGLTAFTVAANVTMFANSNAGLLVNTRYFYRVRATNGAPSAWSNTVTIVTSVPARPTNLAVTGRTQTTVSLSWADNSANELGFYIERATNNSFSANFVRFTGPANTPSFQVTGLDPNRRYYFRVRAFNGLGTSQPSPTVSTTTLP